MSNAVGDDIGRLVLPVVDAGGVVRFRCVDAPLRKKRPRDTTLALDCRRETACLRVVSELADRVSRREKESAIANEKGSERQSIARRKAFAGLLPTSFGSVSMLAREARAGRVDTVASNRTECTG